MDTQFTTLPRPGSGVPHEYGDRVHLLSLPYPMAMLTRLCQQQTQQPEINHLVAALYDWMLSEVSSRLLRTRTVQRATRMAAMHSEGIYAGECIDETQRVVVVDIARGGILPAHRLYHGLHHIIDAEQLRQDHIIASRTTDSEGRVTGVDISASKIGGGVEDATVLIPDPMAATGTSVSAVIDRYKALPGGAPRQIAALHLIATPEYIARMRKEHPEVHIFAIRLDRGLSDAEVLATRPGTRWSEEVGLNSIQYIVPGAGGVGELLNNAWV
ncbi:MAG: uracil phosphoribosyltransferase [Myxococcota bacterium]|jgi:uracil phosphoribosyltransferase